jgi:hypothetical protein
VAGVAAVPLAANAVGFGAGGIAAGSWAAAIMSAEAIATGGGVAAGGFTATCQTIGAVGLAGTPVGWAAAVAATGAAVGGGVYSAGSAVRSHMRELSWKPEGRRGVKDGQWMVLTLEGVKPVAGNVLFYPFPSEGEARRFFEFLTEEKHTRSRILYNPEGEEVERGGVSWGISPAAKAIKAAHCGPVSLCGRNSRLSPPGGGGSGGGGSGGGGSGSVGDGKPSYYGLEPGTVVSLYCPGHRRRLHALGGKLLAVEDGEGARPAADAALPLWHVLTEDTATTAVGRVSVHGPFASEKEARSKFDSMLLMPCPRVLFGPDGREWAAATGMSRRGEEESLRAVRAHWEQHRPGRAVGTALFAVMDAGGGEVRLHPLCRVEGEGAREVGLVSVDGNGVVDCGGRLQLPVPPSEVDGAGGDGAAAAAGPAAAGGAVGRSEALTVVDAGRGEVALHSAAHNRFVRVDGGGAGVSAGGGERDVDSLPDRWRSERFRVDVKPSPVPSKSTSAL